MPMKDLKIERLLQEPELPGFLKALAETIDSASRGRNNGADDLDGFSKLKFEAKREFGQIFVTLKVKFPEAEAPSFADLSGHDAPVMRYSTVKKRLKGSFKAVCHELEAGRMPAARTLEAFFADAAAMVAFPDKGESYYADFTQAVHNFRQTVQQGNPVEALAAARLIDRIKVACHAKYK